MSATDQEISFDRAFRIARYSWPLYVMAGVGVLLGAGVASVGSVPVAIRTVGAIGAIIAAWYACASFWAFHAMFDRSELLSGAWLKDEIGFDPSRWVQINVGLEETTLPLTRVFPNATGIMLDLYNPNVMTEPAVARARQDYAASTSAIVVSPDSLPVEDGWADLVVVTLAAHEIRDKGKRERFFNELRRITAEAGRAVVIEHLRDLPAALAFGPGILHFYPRSEWLRLAANARLRVELERSITPFIRVFVYLKEQG